MIQYPHLNDIYITEKLKNQLFQISNYPMTVISAPTGYGKTTALKWWNEYRKRHIPDSSFHRLTIVDDNIHDFWEDFCSCIRIDHEKLADQMEEMGFPDTKRTMLFFTKLWEKEKKEEKGEIFFVFDDVQLISSAKFVEFFMFISEHLPESVHMILLSRDTVFSTAQTMKLGRTLLNIPRQVLQLGKEEIVAYAQNCGLSIEQKNAQELAKFSDGWISLIYLIFCIFADTGKWQFETMDIDHLIKEVMLDPLSKQEQKFLTVLSITPEFTKEEADFLWGNGETEELLDKLSKENAFITCDTNGVYRYHNLLRQNTLKMFLNFQEEEQKQIWSKLGDWYLGKKESLSAMVSYRNAENWEKLLETVTLDRGSSFNGTHRKNIYDWCENCPEEILRSHPQTILIFALQYFMAGNIPRMLYLNRTLIDVVQNDPGLSKEERDNFIGESEILLGFLDFNNISAMSIHHRKACELMDRKSCLVNHRNPWVFGSPSVLLLYHSKIGELEYENREMTECMPYYYKLTDGHGNGAEYSMQAETYFMQGNFEEAQISCYQAADAALLKEQYSILITSEYTAARLSFLRGDYEQIQKILETLMNRVMESRQFVLLPTIDLCNAWMGSILGKMDLIPEWILEENAVDTLMSVSAPTFLVVKNKVLLYKGDWARIVAASDEMKEKCDTCNMVLCGIYVRIQLSAAYIKLHRKKEAVTELKDAIKMAVPDRIYMPFAEHGEYIGELLEQCKKEGFYKDETGEMLKLKSLFIQSKNQILEKYFGEVIDCGLSKREFEIAVLASDRRTTKEIARELNLSENTIKTHLKHVFDKLGIEGPARNKRDFLEQRMKRYKNNP